MAETRVGHEDITGTDIVIVPGLRIGETHTIVSTQFAWANGLAITVGHTDDEFVRGQVTVVIGRPSGES